MAQEAWLLVLPSWAWHSNMQISVSMMLLNVIVGFELWDRGQEQHISVMPAHELSLDEGPCGPLNGWELLRLEIDTTAGARQLSKIYQIVFG